MLLRRSKKTEHPLWRPDFRDGNALPDIKAIRTDFLLNVVSITLCLALLGYLAFREYRSMELADSIEDVSANVASNAALDRESVRLSREFQKHEASMAEFLRFHNLPLTPDRLLTELVASQPEAIVLESLNFSGGTVTKGRNRSAVYTLILSGTVVNAPENPAPQVITDYRTELAKLPVLEAYVANSELSGFTRNEVLNVFNFTIRLSLRDEAEQPN